MVIEHSHGRRMHPDQPPQRHLHLDEFAPPPPGLASPRLGQPPPPILDPPIRAQTTRALQGNVSPSPQLQTEDGDQSHDRGNPNTRVMSPSGPTRWGPEGVQANSQTSRTSVASEDPHKVARQALARPEAGGLGRLRRRGLVPCYRPARLPADVVEPRDDHHPPDARLPSADLHQVVGGGGFALRERSSAEAELPCGARGRANHRNWSVGSGHPQHTVPGEQKPRRNLCEKS